MSEFSCDFEAEERSILDFPQMERLASAVSTLPFESCDDRKTIQLTPLFPRATTQDSAHPESTWMRGFLSGWGVRFWSGSNGTLNAQHHDDRFMLGGRPSRLDEKEITNWHEDVNYWCAAYVEFQVSNFKDFQAFKVCARLRSMNTPRTFALLFIGKRLHGFEEVLGPNPPVEITGTVLNVPGNASVPFTIRLPAKDYRSPSFFFEQITITLV